MSTSLPRRYTAQEVMEMVDALRASGDISCEQLAGMDMLGSLLTRLESLSDANIAIEVLRIYRSTNGAQT